MRDFVETLFVAKVSATSRHSPLGEDCFRSLLQFALGAGHRELQRQLADDSRTCELTRLTTRMRALLLLEHRLSALIAAGHPGAPGAVDLAAQLNQGTIGDIMVALNQADTLYRQLALGAPANPATVSTGA